MACFSTKEKKPESILSEQQMVDALVEIHLLESAFKLNLVEEASDSLSIDAYYNALFEQKEYSLDVFRNSFDYYSQDPSKMESLLDTTLTRIQMLETN